MDTRFSLSASRLRQISQLATAITFHSSKMLSPVVAKVIVSATNRNCTKEEMRAAVLRATDGRYAPVIDSFRPVENSLVNAHVGFVTAHREVLATTDDRAKRMRQVTASSMLDPQDSSLWDVTAGENGENMLVRRPDEKLTTLLASLEQRDVRAPKLNVMVANVAPQEFVAFVDLEKGELRHGFVVSASGRDLVVQPIDSEETARVCEDAVVEIANTQDGHRETAVAVGIDPTNFDSKSPASMQEYYKALYGYAPAYAEDIVRQIDAHSSM